MQTYSQIEHPNIYLESSYCACSFVSPLFCRRQSAKWSDRNKRYEKEHMITWAVSKPFKGLSAWLGL